MRKERWFSCAVMADELLTIEGKIPVRDIELDKLCYCITRYDTFSISMGLRARKHKPFHYSNLSR